VSSRRLRRELEALKAGRAASRGPDGEPEELAGRIRETAEHANRCEGGPGGRGGSPAFEVTAEGVFCAADGRPVTTWRQTSAEQSWRMQMGWEASRLACGLEPDLTLDSEGLPGGAFRTLDGRFALDRDRQDIAALMGPLTQRQQEAVEPGRWWRFLAADGEAEDLLDGLLGLAEDADVPDGFAAWPSYEPTEAEAEDFPGTMKPTAYFSDAEERDATRRLTWALIHDADARGMLSELTRRRDAFFAG